MADNLRVSIGAESNLAQDLAKAEAQLNAFVGRVKRIGELGDAMTNLGTKLSAGLTLPIVGLGVAAIKSYGEIESLQKGLEAVMGDASRAGKEFTNLKEVAKLPGLGMQEAVKGSINLQAIGISADKSRNILSQFGNAVASVGKGRVEFERAIYGVQQLANTDFPLGEDLNIIKDALPQVSNLLKDAFGSSRSDELAKMGVSSKQVLDTILTGLEKLPRVSGGIKGAFENLGDSIQTNLGRIGKVINDNFNISKIIDKISSGMDKLVSLFEGLNPAIQKTIIVVAGLAAAAGPLLVAVGGFMSMLPTLVSGIGAVKVALAALTGPIGLVTVGLIGIVTAVVANWGKIKPYIEGTINWFRSLYNESKVVRLGVQSIGFAFDGLWVIVKNSLGAVWKNIKIFGKAVLEVFAGIGSVIKGALTGDLNQMGGGLVRATAALSVGFSEAKNNALNFAKTTFDALDGLEKKWSGMTMNGKFTLSDFWVSDDGIAEKTEQAVTNGVKEGFKKAKENLKSVKLDAFIPLNVIPKFNESMSFGDVKIFDTEALDKNLADASSIITTRLTDIQQKILERKLFVTEAFQNMAMDIENLVGSSIGNAVTDAFSSIGEALGSGGNVISALGKSIVGAFGGFLSDMGKMMAKYGGLLIAYGIAEKVLKFSPDPFSKIAAGAALLAIGGALSLAGGAIKGASSGGNSSGNVSGGTGGGSSNYSSSYSSGGGFGNGEVRFRIEGNDLVGVLARQQDLNRRLSAGR